MPKAKPAKTSAVPKIGHVGTLSLPRVIVTSNEDFEFDPHSELGTVLRAMFPLSENVDLRVALVGEAHRYLGSAGSCPCQELKPKTEHERKKAARQEPNEDEEDYDAEEQEDYNNEQEEEEDAAYLFILFNNRRPMPSLADAIALAEEAGYHLTTAGNFSLRGFGKKD